MTRVENPSGEMVPQRPTEANGGSTSAVPKREQFIPLRKAELVECLAGGQGLTPGDAEAFRRLCRLFQGLLHREFQATLEELKNAYAPFDPDADTRAMTELSEDELVGAEDRLFRRFGWLLERGNFKRLAQDEIDRALADRTAWGLNLAVDFDAFERLELYCRGDTIGKRYRRRIANRFRIETVEVAVYQRLVVVFRLRDEGPRSKFLATENVHIKLFKDIPQLDLEMLLPGTRVRMSPFDRARIVLPTLSGVSMAVWKIVVVATAPLYSSLAMLGLVGGTVGYGVRSLYGYLNTKQKYQLNLTQSLYYQNLDNNAGVIHRLVDEAEEQENREAMLAYFFLWRSAGAEGCSGAALDAAIEEFLRARIGFDVDFELGDALDKLKRWGLVTSTTDERWQAIPIEPATTALEQLWARPPQ
jgi:hypothetical protein